MTRRCDRRWPATFFATLTLAGICAAPLAAEEQPASAPQATAAAPKRSPRPGDVVRVFTLSHADALPMAKLLEVFPATIAVASGQGLSQPAIAASGTAAVIAAIEKTINRLDVPPGPRRNVELTGYVLEALAKADATTPSAPPGLEAVVAQLKPVFNYEGYRLVDTVFARSREGSDLMTTGSDQAPSETPRLKYSLSAHISQASNDLISLNKLLLQVEVRKGFANTPHLMRTDIGLRPGHQVVVGKSGGSEPGNAVILILRGNIVE